MGFELLAVGALVAVFLMLLAIGRWHPGTNAEVLDWKPTRSYEDEAGLELEEVDQMIEAQNERRRRSGRPELTEDEIRAQVHSEQTEQQHRSARYRKGG